jgi:UDP-N-acetylglucosamine acyltransferase
LTVEAALAELAEDAKTFAEVAMFRDSIQASTRGITR